MRTSDVRAASDAAPRRAVSPLELFFDLVFVFAVGQLAEHPHSAPSWRGAAETAMMLIAVLTTWVLTSFDATFLDITPPGPEGWYWRRWAFGLFMNAQNPHAFTGRPWAFVVPLAAILLLTGDRPPAKTKGAGTAAAVLSPQASGV
ncbi:low temperature requirement protein A [Actinomadura geliboluensis]|uniref:low temperature requirement protein A n=1 Tax=Actinomadura geliboluensis TaxID=882440 RepID=UPI00197AF02D|nr:low temperature requirement protein A [Actinomadura geliboluensis]